ncbi:MAG: Hsp20/alpha crystallin family protein [Candidatus Thermoplasmatota archaeon]
MQEHSNPNKDTESVKARRSNPIIVDGTRMGPSNAEALRDVHMSLVRAEQNLYNLVQANHAANAANGSAFGPAAFAYGAQPGFAPSFAPGFPPGFAPTTGIPTPSGLAFGVTAAPWATAPTASWNASPAALATWGALNPSLAAQGLAPAYVPSALVPASASFGIASRIPACDISDEGKQYVCQLDLPGLRAEQVELLCTDHTVVVNAHRESESDASSLVQAERGTTTQQRTITLPHEILPGGVKATLSNGVLTVVLPKAQPTEGPRRIKIQG